MSSFLYTATVSYIPYFSDPSFQALNDFATQSQYRTTQIFNISSPHVDAVINYILTTLKTQKAQNIKIDNLIFVEIDVTITSDNGIYTYCPPLSDPSNHSPDMVLLTPDQIDAISTKDQILKINDVLETINSRLTKLENPTG